MRYTAALFPLFACCLMAGPIQPLSQRPSTAQSIRVSSFEEKLDRRVERFDTLGRTLATSVVDLAYEYELPIGIEYLDPVATARPISLQLHSESVRGILVAIIQQAPEYRVSFSDGLVDIYTPKAREDSSNLLNKVIKNFAVTGLDTHEADLELLCTLSREVEPQGGCGGSIATGQWGLLKITVHLQNAKVYEIVNAIVAQNGKAVWTVIAPPDKLSKIPVGGLWHIYPLEPPFESAVLHKLASIPGDAGEVVNQ
jgi:hypothetical protein